MNIENIIIIKGGAYADVKKSLRNWLDHYVEDLVEEVEFKLFKNGSGSHVIQADENLYNDYFFYLISFLRYSLGLESNIEILGFTRGNDDNSLKDKDLMVYNLPIDMEGDNVYVSTSDNEFYRVEFGIGIKKVKEGMSYQLPGELMIDNPEVLKVNKDVPSIEKEKTEEEQVAIRFKWFSGIAIGLIFLCSLLYFYSKESYVFYQLILGVLIGTWFVIDYEMLRIHKYYINCLLISLVFIGSSTIINHVIGSSENLFDNGVLHPLLFLLIQRPTRIIFKMIFKREPMVGWFKSTFWDSVYTLLLFLELLIMPLVLEGLM